MKTKFSVPFICALMLFTATSFAQTDSSSSPRKIQTSFFAEPLVSVGSEKANLVETKQLQDITKKASSEGFEANLLAMEEFANSNPNSPWTASLLYNLGQFYAERLSFNKAISAWTTAWNATSNGTDANSKHIADMSYASLAKLLIGIGKADELGKLISQGEGRTFERGFAYTAARQTKEQYLSMIQGTDKHFRCGAYALEKLAQALKLKNFNTQLLKKTPSTSSGFSAAKLVEIGALCGCDLVAVKWNNDKVIPAPAIVHWKVDHYAAIMEEKNGFYRVQESIYSVPVSLSKSEILEEASGIFIIPKESITTNWTMLTSSEAEDVFGRGYFNTYPDVPDGCGNGSGGSSAKSNSSSGGNGSGAQAASCRTCGRNPERPGNPGSPGSPGLPSTPPTGGSGTSCSNCPSGMPVWEVSEPTINMWLYDEPLAYQPGNGKRIAFKLSYKQRDVGCLGSREVGTKFFNFGKNWNSSWLNYVAFRKDLGNPTAYMFLANGGWRYYQLDSSEFEYNSRSKMRYTTSNNVITSLIVDYPNGDQDIYGFIASNHINTYYDAALLTAQINQGKTTSFIYEETNGTVFLRSIVDNDGRTCTLGYSSDENFPAEVTSVTDPFRRTATLQYDANGMLTNITDTAQLSSSFIYDSNLWITQLTTPYGNTHFEYLENSQSGDEFYVIRAVRVTDAEGGTNVYMLRENSNSVYTNATDLEYFGLSDDNNPDNRDIFWLPFVPTNTPSSALVDSALMCYRDTFHWGPKQAENLPLDMNTFSTNDLVRGEMKHWLHDGSDSMGQTLSMSREPSPDGLIPGQITWYDYDGRDSWNPQYEGTNSQPSVIARRLPDGTSWYKQYQRDSWGHATNIIETYSTAGQTPLTRSHQYIYNSSNDLIQVIGPNGETLGRYQYNTNHQVTLETNAVGLVTTNEYDSVGRLRFVRTPSGLVAGYTYGTDGYLASVTNNISTNSYTYSNGLLRTSTDERNLTKTYFYDGLNRLTGVLYPDTSSESNIYTKLDITAKKDRLGKWTYYSYDGLRRLTNIVNALNHNASYSYCPCGSLDNSTDFLGKSTSYEYDDGGRLTRVDYPDGYYLNYQYDLMGQITCMTDPAGVATYYFYNNQGLRYCVSNSLGVVSKTTYDIEDRPVTTVDANGVTITSTFDNLGRVLTRSNAVAGVESFQYNNYGLFCHSDQATNKTYYQYDVALRKIGETNALTYTNGFTYNGAGDLIALTDGKGHKTSWYYDSYGRVLFKTNDSVAWILQYTYQTNGLLKTRTNNKGTTTYGYDDVGNLTSVVYGSGKTITYQYDAMNHLTNMVDPVGTTVYSYTDAGLLQSEDGPWANDTVSYTYTNRMRQSMTLGIPSGSALSTTYDYDGINRLKHIVSWTGTFTYNYNSSPSPEVLGITLPTAAYITNTFDGVARELTTKLCNSSSSPLNYHNYGYNNLSQRTYQTNNSGNYTAYTYDKTGQLLTASGAEGSTNRANEQLKYGYDAAGNLYQRTNNALIQTFGVDNLNQLSTAARTGTLTVGGATSTNVSSVTVNDGTTSVPATRYGDNSFAATNFTPVSGSKTYTAIGVDGSGNRVTNSVIVNLASSVTYTYDTDGNLTSDGVRTFNYDEENQLTNVSVAGSWKVEFQYDGKMRRRVMKEYNLNGTVTNEVHYIYDGNVVVEERDWNNTLRVGYVRGKDHSGSFQGAGGIGGLLARVDYTTGTAVPAYYHSDANGNVTCLTDGSQNVVARYAYDPYGNLLAKSGTLADANVYRFSSKEWNENSGLVYYLYRFYEPNLQRWLNRDPLSEKGHIILRNMESALGHSWLDYHFVDNNPINKIDPLGLIPPPVAGCLAGGTLGGIGGALGGLGAALSSGCWKPIICGAAGGATAGCTQGAACSTGNPKLCVAGGCIGGALGSIVEQACNGSLDLKNPCTWINTFLNTAVGCLGGAAESVEDQKASLVQFVLGITVSSVGNMCQ